MDNLGDVLWTQTYGDATDSGGSILYSSATCRAETHNFYDSLGQVYQSDDYYVDPTTGDAGAYLPTYTLVPCRRQRDPDRDRHDRRVHEVPVQRRGRADRDVHGLLRSGR